MNHPANNPPTVSSSRRRFLKQAVGASTVFAVPNIFTVSLFGLSGRAIAEPVSPWRMRLAFSSVMLAELPIEEVCARAAQMGFEAIDIWCPFDNCKHLADVVARLGPDGLKALLAKHNLALASFTTYRVGPETVGFPAYADFIGNFGGAVVVRESEYKRVKPEDLTSAMRAFFEKLKPQIEKAAETKVRLAIENHGDALLNSPDSFKAFIDLNPAPQHVGLGIAPYHLQNMTYLNSTKPVLPLKEKYWARCMPQGSGPTSHRALKQLVSNSARRFLPRRRPPVRTHGVKHSAIIQVKTYLEET